MLSKVDPRLCDARHGLMARLQGVATLEIGLARAANSGLEHHQIPQPVRQDGDAHGETIWTQLVQA